MNVPPDHPRKRARTDAFGSLAPKEYARHSGLGLGIKRAHRELMGPPHAVKASPCRISPPLCVARTGMSAHPPAQKAPAPLRRPAFQRPHTRPPATCTRWAKDTQLQTKQWQGDQDVCTSVLGFIIWSEWRGYFVRLFGTKEPRV